jgi:hypothetical protein
VVTRVQDLPGIADNAIIYKGLGFVKP